MSKLKPLKNQISYVLNYAMQVLDKAIQLIPDDKLDFKPVDEVMSITDLPIHIYMATLVFTAGILKGEFNNEDYSLIPFDSENIKSAVEIVEFGKKVKDYARDALEKFTEADLDKEITYNCWGGFKMTGARSLHILHEETIHHRGQLFVYLRSLGIEPPFIYGFD
ncbi:MAG: DinB family protein [Candidatus Hodarchaeota archaeon]